MNMHRKIKEKGSKQREKMNAKAEFGNVSVVKALCANYIICIKLIKEKKCNFT